MITNSDPFLCPSCGWTGTRTEAVDFDDTIECPICAELVKRRYEEQPMPDSDPVLCPVCSWSGEQDQVKDNSGPTQCPICAETVKILD